MSDTDKTNEHLCFELAEVIFVSLNKDQTVSFINPKGCDVLGYPKEEILGKNWFDHFLPKESAEEIKEVFNKIVSGEIDYGKFYENSILTKSGQERIIRWHNTMLKDENGNITGTLSSGTDITEKKLAEKKVNESEASFFSVLENAPYGVMLMQNENFIFFNSTCINLLGYELFEIPTLKEALPKLFPNPNDQKEIYHIWQTDFQNKKTDGPRIFSFTSKNGSIREIQLIPSFSQDGKVVVMLNDLTDKKKLTDSLKNKLELEETINKISSNFIGTPNINNAISLAIQEICSLCKSDNFFLFLFNEQKSQVMNISSPCEDKIDPSFEHLQNIPKDQFSWWTSTLNKKKSVYIKTFAELPKQAKVELELLNLKNKNSLFFLSFNVKKNLAGFMGFDNIKHDQKWLAENDSLLKIFSQILGTAFERKQTEDSLYYRQKFEQLITSISTNFINLSPEQIDQEIEKSLEAIGKFTGIDRAFIYQVTEDRKKLVNTHGWYKKGITYPDNILTSRSLELDKFPWFNTKTNAPEIFSFQNLEDFPKEATPEKENLKHLNIQSIVGVPLIWDGKVNGYLGLISILFSKKWSEDDIILLKIVGEIFTNALNRKKSKDLLDQTQIQYETLFKNANDAIFIADTETGIILEVNKQSEILMGYSRQELVGMHQSQLHPKEEVKRYKKQFQTSIQGKNQNIESKIIQKDGTIIPVWINSSLIYLGKRKIIYGTFKDLSSIKHFQNIINQNEQQYQLTIDSIDDLIHVVDTDLKIILYNKMVQRYALEFGVMDDLIGKNIFKLFPFLDRKKIISEYKDVFDTGYPSITEEKTAIDEQIIYTETRKIPIFDNTGKVFQIITIIRNITERKKNENKLKASEDKFKTLAKESPNMIFINANGKIIYANKKCSELMGYSNDEFLSPDFNFLNLIAPEFVKDIQSNFKKHSQNKNVPPLEYALITKKGQQIECILTTKLIQYGDANAILGIVTDISERIKAEKILKASEDKFKTLAEESPNMIFINALGKIVYANKRCSEIMDYTNDEFLSPNFNFLCLVAPESLNHVQISFKKQCQGKELPPTEYTFVTKKGRKIDSMLSTKLINYQGQKAILGMITEITDLKATEYELKKALLKAQETDKLKTAFLTNISHEMRTPLFTIMGYSDLMSESDLSSENKNFMQIIKKSGNSLLKSINRILDLSKIQAQQIKIDKIPFSVSEVLNHLHSQFKIMLSEKEKPIPLKLNIDKKINSSILGDPTHLQAIMANLLDNAVKFTEKGTIEYGANLIKKEKETFLEFYVKDTGIGIPKEKEAIIFEAFQQADMSKTKPYLGIGLGLTITEKLAKLLGSQLEFTTQTGKNHGSRFFLTFPYEPIDVPKSKQSSVKKSSLKQKQTLLLAEDDSLNQTVVKKILEKEGYHVLTADDGVDVISMYKSNPQVELILMDLYMPSLSGIDATKKIREIEKQKKKKDRIPIIALTAAAMKEDEDECFKAGCDDYLTKPFKKETLLKKIRLFFKK